MQFEDSQFDELRIGPGK